MPTGASSTPSIYRTDTPDGRTHLRSQFDGELWDDLANVVYFSDDTGPDNVTLGTNGFFCSLDIPCPIRCRLEIDAQVFSDIDVDWDGYIQVDGVDTFRAEVTRLTGGISILVSWFGCADVDPGTHTVRIRVNTIFTDGQFYSLRIKVRRGRTPQS